MNEFKYYLGGCANLVHSEQPKCLTKSATAIGKTGLMASSTPSVGILDSGANRSSPMSTRGMPAEVVPRRTSPGVSVRKNQGAQAWIWKEKGRGS